MAPAITGCATPAITEFETTLAAHDSATAALEEWCARKGIAAEPRVSATLIETGAATGADRDDPGEARAALGIGPGQPLGYRHVRLDCGGVVLSEAYNWYAPALLTPQMNQALATTRTPFGKVAAPLGYRRELLAAQRGAQGGCPPGIVLSHRALLRLPDGRPLALLVECYTEAVVAR